MPEYNGTIPTDLEKIKPDWTAAPVNMRTRVCAAKLAGLIAPYGVTAVTITLIEQPGQIPGNNATGMMPWAKEFPWGWSVAKWATVRPTGYFTAKEGEKDAAGKSKIGVFFAFARLADSLKLCADTCRKRDIQTGVDYCRRWVGQEKPKAATAAAFEQIRAKVAKMWTELDSTLCGPSA